MIGSAPKPARREEEAPSGAAILPFRLRVGGANAAFGRAQAPAVELERKPAAASKRAQATVSGVAPADRPTILPPRYRGWLKQALIAAVLLHLVAFAAMHVSFVNDVERAANAGGKASDGATVLDIEIVAELRLPPAKTSSNMTSPDAVKQTNTPPQVKQQERQAEAKKAEIAPNNAPQFVLPKEEFAQPKKAETSETAQSPNQKKVDTAEAKPKAAEQPKAEAQKKRQEQAAPSIAAAPSRAAGSPGNQSQAGASGQVQHGGQAAASSYNALVIAHLQRYRVYPEAARAVRATGVSTVRFTLAASGTVVAVSLAVSSGTGTLDQAAIAMVQRASPFPPIPASLGLGSITFAAPVRFNLR